MQTGSITRRHFIAGGEYSAVWSAIVKAENRTAAAGMSGSSNYGIYGTIARAGLDRCF